MPQEAAKRGSAEVLAVLYEEDRCLQLLEPSREWRVKGGAERWKSETNGRKVGEH